MYACPEGSPYLAIGCHSKYYTLKDPLPAGCQDDPPCNQSEIGIPACDSGEALVFDSVACQYTCIPTGQTNPINPITAPDDDETCTGVDYDNYCYFGRFGDAATGSVWKQLVSNDCPSDAFPSPCKKECGCGDVGRIYYVENEPSYYEDVCVGENGENNCAGEIVEAELCYQQNIFMQVLTCVDGVLYTDTSLCQEIGPCDPKPPVIIPPQ